MAQTACLRSSHPGFRKGSRRSRNARRYYISLSFETPRCGESHRRTLYQRTRRRRGRRIHGQIRRPPQAIRMHESRQYRGRATTAGRPPAGVDSSAAFAGVTYRCLGPRSTRMNTGGSSSARGQATRPRVALTPFPPSRNVHFVYFDGFLQCEGRRAL